MLGPEPIVISKSCSQPQAVAWHLDNASESVFHLTKEKLKEKQKRTKNCIHFMRRQLQRPMKLNCLLRLSRKSIRRAMWRMRNMQAQPISKLSEMCADSARTGANVAFAAHKQLILFEM